MEKLKNVQIPQSLFTDLIKYFYCGDKAKEESIKQELSGKLDKMVKRELYSKCRVAKSDAECKIALQEYILSLTR